MKMKEKKNTHKKKQDIVFLTLKISKMLQGSMPPAPPPPPPAPHSYATQRIKPTAASYNPRSAPELTYV